MWNLLPDQLLANPKNVAGDVGSASLYCNSARGSVAFPLTLTFSPEEREQPKPRREPKALANRRPGVVAPSPQGRGRGEGEGGGRISARLQDFEMRPDVGLIPFRQRKLEPPYVGCYEVRVF